MSHSHIRAEPEPPPPVPQVARGVFIRLAAFTCLLILVIAIGLAWVNYRDSTFLERHLSADGTVSEVRIVVDHADNTTYSGKVVYRLEARALFTAEGRFQNRWLLAAEPSSSTGWLRLQIPTPIEKCIVYWVPGHLENARCKLK